MIESLLLAGSLAIAPVTAGTATPMIAAAAIPQRWRAFSACVSERESNGNYRARNRSSSAQGRWQFLDTPWRVNGGIEWIVLRQMKRHGATWAERRKAYMRLSTTRIQMWPAWAQDAAFVGVVTERPTGWRHWSLPGSRCDRLVP